MILTQKRYINIPRKMFLDLQEASVNRGACLLLFCYMIRFSSFDGFFHCSLRMILDEIMNKNEISTGRTVTKFEKDIIRSFDYLVKTNVLDIVKGDYTKKDCIFKGKINEKYLNVKADYLSISVFQFDYLLNFTGRTNKANMFLLLFWIINCSTKNDEGIIINACSYSMKYMSETLGFTQPSIIKYLSKLCGTPDTAAPLLYIKNKTIKINGEYKRFPNIYVKNDEFAKRNIELQKKYIKSHFIMPKVGNSDTSFTDYEDLY